MGMRDIRPEGGQGPTRRGLLMAGLAAGTAAGTGAWHAAEPDRLAGPSRAAVAGRSLRKPGSLPYPDLPAGRETKWNLPAMTFRDANANNMLDMLNLKRPAFIKPPKLADPLYATDASAVLCSILGPGTIPPPGSVTRPSS